MLLASFSFLKSFHICAQPEEPDLSVGDFEREEVNRRAAIGWFFVLVRG